MRAWHHPGENWAIGAILCVCAAGWLLLAYFVFGVRDPSAPLVLGEHGASIAIQNECNVPFWPCDELEQSVLISRTNREDKRAPIGLSCGDLRVQVYRLNESRLLFAGSCGGVTVDLTDERLESACPDRRKLDCKRFQDALARAEVSNPTRSYLGAFDALRPRSSVGRRGFGFLPASQSPERDPAPVGR